MVVYCAKMTEKVQNTASVLIIKSTKDWVKPLKRLDLIVITYYLFLIFGSR